MINQLVGRIYEHIPLSNRIERIWKLAKIDFKKRYYNDRLGILWALIMPLMQIAIYYFVFKYVFAYEKENYGIFLYSGLVLWLFFTESVNRGMHILRAKRYLIENIQFDKLDLFISHVFSVAFGFVFNLVAYYAISCAFGVIPGWQIVYLPVIILSVVLLSFGTTLIMSILKLYLEDLQHAWDILLLLGFWTAGVFFDTDALVSKIPFLEYAHPFIGIMKNMRNISMYGMNPDMGMLLWCLLYGVLISTIGILIFRRFSHKIIEQF